MTTPLRAWFRNVFGRPAVERALDEEVRACVEILAAERVTAGMDPATARREALMEIGNVEVVKERVRDVRRGSRLEAWWRDLRHGGRSLGRQPWVTTAVVVTLAVGIGTPTTVFSLLGEYAFRAPVSSDPGAYVRVVRANRMAQGVATAAQYEAFRTDAESLRELTAWSSLYMSAPLGADDPTRLMGLFASCNVFTVLGVGAPLAGRLLTPDDCLSERPVAVLGEQAWRSRFGGDRSIVGESVSYGGVPMTLVGVVAAPAIQRRAHSPDPPELVDLWIPYTAFRPLRDVLGFGNRDLLSPSNTHPWLEMAGLLAADHSRESATTELRRIDERPSSDERVERARRFAGPIVLTDGTAWSRVPAKTLELMAMALALPVVILIAACVNTAGLLLSRAVGRQKEMAARLALGAGKSALLRLMFVEGLLLAALAGAASLLLVFTLPPVLIRLWGAGIAFGTTGPFVPGWQVFAFLAAAGLVAAVLTSLAPALEASNPRIAEALQGSRSLLARPGTFRMRRSFVAIQVGACLVLLVVAGSVVRTVEVFMRPGIRTDGLLTVQLRDSDGTTTSLRSLAEELATVPGVRSVARSDLLPLVRESALRIRTPGGADELRPFPLVADVSPEYFEAFDLPTLAGRTFAESDWVPGDDTARPVVVSRQFAERFFGGPGAVGQTLSESADDGGRFTIVGIVADRLSGLSMFGPAMNDGSAIYRLMDPDSTTGYLTIWAAGDPESVAGLVAARLRNLTGAARSVEPFESLLAERLAVTRHLVTLLFALGGTALLLAMLGIVGTVMADASRRAREYAIRLALGASPVAIRRHVVRSGLGLLPIGLGVGLFISWGVLRLVEAQRIVPLASIARDPVTYGAVVVVLTAVAFVAVLGVAYPVGRRDPLVALREE